MSHAEICPVCAGAGCVESYPMHGQETTVPLRSPCHGCGGLGWVTVRDSDEKHDIPPWPNPYVGDTPESIQGQT